MLIIINEKETIEKQAATLAREFCCEEFFFFFDNKMRIFLYSFFFQFFSPPPHSPTQRKEKACILLKQNKVVVKKKRTKAGNWGRGCFVFVSDQGYLQKKKIMEREMEKGDTHTHTQKTIFFTSAFTAQRIRV